MMIKDKVIEQRRRLAMERAWEKGPVYSPDRPTRWHTKARDKTGIGQFTSGYSLPGLRYEDMVVEEFV